MAAFAIQTSMMLFVWIFSIPCLLLTITMFTSMSLKFYNRRKELSLQDQNIQNPKTKQIHLTIILPTLIMIGSFTIAICIWLIWCILIWSHPNRTVYDYDYLNLFAIIFFIVGRVSLYTLFLLRLYRTFKSSAYKSKDWIYIFEFTLCIISGIAFIISSCNESS